MKCPKCHKEIADDLTICPHCNKVLALLCPNCHSKSDSSVCKKCGYIILVKCAKCGKVVSTSADKCKCGFPVKTTIAYKECECDDFASLVIQFGALKNIRSQLASQELFSKFFLKLKNLLIAQLANVEGTIITYSDIFVVNFNKELSFPTSTNKAVRLALKLVNAFSELNLKVLNELKTPLNLNIYVLKKKSENLLDKISVDSNVKLLSVKKNEKKFLKGMQIIIDQYVFDCINKEYKTDSLYSVEKDGQSLMYYEVVLDNYILPPEEKSTDTPVEIKPHNIQKVVAQNNNNDMYSFKVFDINAKCSFFKTNALNFWEQYKDNKIISIKTEKGLGLNVSKLTNFFEQKGLNVIHVACCEEMNFKPWGFFEQLFKDFYNLPLHKSFLPANFPIKRFLSIFELIKSNPRKATTPEDARFAYMEDFGDFLASLKNSVIIIENFEFLDDTSIQTLELFFDKFKSLNSKFVFTTDCETSLHSKIKGLLRTPLYTEYTLTKNNIDSILANTKEDATDFIQSFYFEKIKENFNGSLIYYENAIRFLFEKKILINFENKLLIRGSNSVIVPKTLEELIKARLKILSKNMDASIVLAYSTYLGARLDFETLTKLGVKNPEKAGKDLENAGFAFIKKNIIHIDNYNLLKPVIQDSLKKEVNEFLSKNILANIGKGLDDASTLLIMGKLGLFKEEYLLLWKNSQFAMSTGDYDAYLKNCLGFLSLIEHIGDNIPQEDIENNKKEVYQNILLSLYNYSPEKIYSIENVLLIDAMNEGNNEKIVKLSNLMLQGALLASNYTDALSLLHNILTRMSSPTLVTQEGSVNTKFLLLSLVNIEILFNIGDFTQCVDVANDLLKVLKPEIIDKIKPPSFSTNLFIEHILETFRLVAFAKVFLLENDLDEFFSLIRQALNVELPDKDCIITFKEFLSGKAFATSNVENASTFSKIIYLIIQEFAIHKDDYKTFAQNIYQAKLLAADIHQTQIEMFCDLLIAYSYANIGIKQKAEIIYNDVLEKAQKAAIFNIITLAKYFIAKLNILETKYEEALFIINDTLALLQKHNNQAKITYVLFEKLFIETVKLLELDSIDLSTEEQKLALTAKNNELARLM